MAHLDFSWFGDAATNGVFAPGEVVNGVAVRFSRRDPAAPLCAIGDMHGDLDHALAALRLCGAVDADGAWVGGGMTVVQTGDVVDRGNASVPTLHMLWGLRRQAALYHSGSNAALRSARACSITSHRSCACASCSG